jgi:hypothetical protein
VSLTVTPARWLAPLLLLGLVACSYDAAAPGPRLKCERDQDCGPGGRCLPSTVATDAGGTTTVKLCCVGNACAAVAPDADGSPDAMEPDGPLSIDPDDGGAGDAEALDGANDDAVDDSASVDGESLSCATTCPGGPNAQSSCVDGQCRYTCEDGWGACGATPESAGGCTTLLNASAHCGTCGRTCACTTSGQCPPELVLASVSGGAKLLPALATAFDPVGRWLYFVNGETNQLQRVNLDGTVEKVLEEELEWPEFPRLSGEYLYWTEGSSSYSLRRIRVADIPRKGPVEDVVKNIASGDGSNHQLTILPPYAYWVVGSALGKDLHIAQRRLLAGGAIETLVAPPEQAVEIYFAPGGIFWDAGEWGKASIRRANLDGSEPRDFVFRPGSTPTAEVRLRMLGVDAQYVYWNDVAYKGGEMWRLAQDATPGTPAQLVARLPREFGRLTTVTFDGAGKPYLEWKWGTIVGVAQFGRLAYTLTNEEVTTQFGGVAIDATHVYFLDSKNGAFWRMPK